MELVRHDKELESLNEQLNDPAFLEAYKAPYDNYKTSIVPTLLGNALIFFGNLIYGHTPSYLKFRAVEIIARVPYHSWESASYTLLTLFFSNERKALELSRVTRFSRMAQDNETMHVVVISQLAKQEQKAGMIRHSLIPMLFAFFYFWMSYVLYLLNYRWSFQLNYLFESHAFDQYSRFLELFGPELEKKPMRSDFLDWYGRYPHNQYEFFRSIRNDEIVHRNESIHEIENHTAHRAANRYGKEFKSSRHE